MTEKRCLVNRQSRFKTRADEETGKRYISGYFAVFDDLYEMWQGATEEVDPHAFDEALDDDIRCLADHDSRIVLGRNIAGTLTLKIDNKGLWGEVEINPNDTEAMNVYARVKRGDVNQCSFAFDVIEQEEHWNGNAVHWILKKVKLYEVSVVTFPAYEGTEVDARRKEVEKIKKRQAEAFKARMLQKLKGEK